MQTQVKCEHTELVDPNQLNPHPDNPNKHPKNQIRMLAKSIQAYGWRHPIVVSKRSGFIIAGHARRQAAVELDTKAPVDFQDFTTDEAERAVLLADNILPELAEMDHQLFTMNRDILLDAHISLETIGIPEIDVPDFPAETEGDQAPLDKKKDTTCPECGYVFQD